jgi:hypothetical protein
VSRFGFGFALLLLLGPGPAAAESTTLAESATVAVGQVLRGHFIQERHLEGFARPVRSEGRFSLIPGRGLIWRAETPFAVTTVVTPAGLVQSLDGVETTRLSTARLPFLARIYAMMNGALAGDWRALETEFVVRREPAGPVTRVTLSLRRPDAADAVAIRSITATVGHFVETVDLIKPGGDFDHLDFADQNISTAPLPADEAALLDAAGRAGP